MQKFRKKYEITGNVRVEYLIEVEAESQEEAKQIFDKVDLKGVNIIKEEDWEHDIYERE